MFFFIFVRSVNGPRPEIDKSFSPVLTVHVAEVVTLQSDTADSTLPS